MRGKLILGLACIFACIFVPAKECRGEIAGDEAFSGLTWEQVYEEERQRPDGVVQSICSTEHYIICIENTSDFTDEPDTVSAYYKNDVDENGNPVTRYTLAKRVYDTNWEHGNGMAYNPNTHEIYVALYTNQKPENRGCLFVMDPDTLQYKRSIKVSDHYNVLGIDYKSDTNQYVIQTDATGGFGVKLLDENFQVVEELGDFGENAKGINFQDLVVDGDYVMNFPLTLGLNIGDFLQVFSLSRRSMVVAPQLDFGFQNITADEPEGMCRIAPGEYLAAVNVTDVNGAKLIRFYKTVFPYYFQITVTTEDGTVWEQTKVLRGEDYQVTYTPGEGERLGSLVIDGQEIDGVSYQNGYTLENVQADQQVQVRFEPIPVVTQPPVPTEEPVVKNVSEKETAASIKGQSRAMSISPWAVVIGVAAFGVVLAFVCFYIHIRLERKRRYLRARARRRRQRLTPELQ